MLDWSRSELAKEARVSPETIKNIEHGIFIPQKSTLATLIETFARRGIQFVRYESVVAVPAGCEPVGRELALSYAGVVRVTASIFEIGENGNG
jgi:DNA-binding XRE family transcriptional regulator